MRTYPSAVPVCVSTTSGAGAVRFLRGIVRPATRIHKKWNDVIKTFKSETQTLKEKDSINICCSQYWFQSFQINLLIKKWTKDLPLSWFEIVKCKSGVFWAPASWCLAVTFRISPAVTFTFSSHTLLQVICTTIVLSPTIQLQDDKMQCSWTIKTMARPRAHIYP